MQPVDLTNPTVASDGSISICIYASSVVWPMLEASELWLLLAAASVKTTSPVESCVASLGRFDTVDSSAYYVLAHKKKTP
jgi:hypothetical protein